MIDKWRTLFRNGDYDLIVQDATTKTIDSLSIADFNYLGLSALASQAHDWFIDQVNTPPPANLAPYLSLYTGSLAYQQKDYTLASELILSTKEKVIQNGYIFGRDACSWLRGVNSYVHSLDNSAPFKLSEPEITTDIRDLQENFNCLCFLVSADSNYLSRFGQALIDSFIEHRDDDALLLISVINPSTPAKVWISDHAVKLRKSGIYFLYTSGPENRAYYASSRFLLTPLLLDLIDLNILAFDIDAVFTNPTSAIRESLKNFDCAFAQQEFRLPWQRCQAGRVYLSNTASGKGAAKAISDFCRLVYNDCIDQWFIDQNALEYYRRINECNPSAKLGNLYKNELVINSIFCPPGSQKKQLEGLLYQH
ncbi:hypothetical protein OO306_23640 [Pseudomonas sp. DCB_AW]|uniref:hypothetical protein n=1 Tax=Pseudomonas sp. DCB_AW TaxID=2993596 RepID=UPI002248F17C|nr:hypothetical protein [Pseudomonas sp. DCB_AW]MCX2688521.1 hypothetical protein [Pseudomonas sp. DCB_AW]